MCGSYAAFAFFAGLGCAFATVFVGGFSGEPRFLLGGELLLDLEADGIHILYAARMRMPVVLAIAASLRCFSCSAFHFVSSVFDCFFG
jgi:hypothetical protein